MSSTIEIERSDAITLIRALREAHASEDPNILKIRCEICLRLLARKIGMSEDEIQADLNYLRP